MELKYSKYIMYSSLNAIACESGAEPFPIRLTETEVSLTKSLVRLIANFPFSGTDGKDTALTKKLTAKRPCLLHSN